MFLDKKLSNKIWRFLAQTTASFCKHFTMTLVFEKKRRKLEKIAAKLAIDSLIESTT
jgi:hypothetical protein